MKRKRVFSLLLCLCLALSLLPTFALADGTAAAVNYLDITMTGETPTCIYKGTAAADTEGILIENGSYSFSAAYDGYIVVSNAAVTYTGAVDLSRFGSSIYVFGTGSFAAGNVTVTRGGYDTEYRGNDGAALLSFINGLRDGNTDYSYTLNADAATGNFLTAYALTIPTGKTLTVSAPAEDSEELPTYNRLTVTHALTVNGTLTAAAGQVLEIGENAAVSGSGFTLYDTNGTSTYTFTTPRSAEEFSYTNTGTEETPVWRWVYQANSGGEGGGEGGGTQTAPAVSFRVQNSDASVGTVLYKINGGEWTSLALTLTGDAPNQYLSGTITGTLAQNDTISIKATPAAGYGMDSTRGVVVWVDGNSTAISGGAEAIITGSGLSYTLTANTNNEFEFGFQQTVNSGGGDPGSGDPGGGDVPPAESPDYGSAKMRLESRHWAYGGAAVEASFKAELWDLMSHEFQGMFINKDACSAAVTMSAGTTDATDDFTGHSYYTASVTLFDDTTQANDITVSLRVYVLSGTAECVVKYGTAFLVLSADTADAAGLTVTKKTQGGTASLSDVQLIIGDVDPDAVEIFGNGVMANTLAASGHHAAWHITPPPSLTSLSQLNFVLAVYNKDFLGAKITSSDDGGTAAAWDGMGQYPVVPLSFTDEWSVFFGNSSVTISSMALSSLGTVTGVAPADGSPAAAAAITSNGNGTWTVTFGSAFYDEVPLTITVNGTAYSLTIRRVGIGIQGIGRGQGDDSCTINQGTQPGSTLTWAEGDQYAVVATFYYPKSMFSSKKSGTAVDDGFGGSYYPWEYTIPHRVSLVVNYAYRDGRTETKIVDTGVLTADSYGYFVPADDFILYKGTRANAPASVCVTAILTSSGTAFGGAKLGSGAGVSWTRRADA